ncbi:MAG: hypothetical protein AB1634_03485 [Thermodesulfobacteriota bacterium]
MSAGRRLITDNASWRAQHHHLVSGDVIACRLGLKPGEEHLLVDLLERGVTLFPSATAQLASRSKVLQAALFGPWMVPHTLAIRDQHELVAAFPRYAQAGVGPVITKSDRANAGMGILRWPDLEAVFAQASLGTLAYPFVLQPFVAGATDIRAIFLGDHHEAYRRHNPHNFRHNLHFGGSRQPVALTAAQERLCGEVMARGRFPYGHLDLLVGADGVSYLSEINLRGGLKGARIKGAAYLTRLAAIHADFCARLAEA